MLLRGGRQPPLHVMHFGVPALHEMYVVPRNHGHNTVLDTDFDIELGNTADEPKDDSDSGHLSCSFDDGLCGWISNKDGDLHWETTPDPTGN
ncbi:hypothetical protein AMECASPLE_023544 [Ameca splendens]|uniref:MAM domain-containing protein n=1 Tax=Ameca splendens TaxID=208324 RepID=A0ABV1AAF8_9TELE